MNNVNNELNNVNNPENNENINIINPENNANIKHENDASYPAIDQREFIDLTESSREFSPHNIKPDDNININKPHNSIQRFDIDDIIHDQLRNNQTIIVNNANNNCEANSFS